MLVRSSRAVSSSSSLTLIRSRAPPILQNNLREGQLFVNRMLWTSHLSIAVSMECMKCSKWAPHQSL